MRDLAECRNKELEAEIDHLKTQLNENYSFNIKLENITKEAELSKVNAGKAMNEANEECIALKRQLHDLGAELLVAKNERTNFKFELENLQRQRDVLEGQLKIYQDESIRNKSESMNRFESLYNSAKAEIDYLKQNNEKLDQLLTQQNGRVAELNEQIKEQKVKLKSEEEKVKMLKEENKELSDQLVAYARP